MHRNSTLLPFLLAIAPGPMATRLARTVGGLLLGTALGLAVGLGVVVYEARFENHFLESTDDILGWRAFPIPAGLALGAAGGWSAPALLAGGGLGGVVGGAAGALIGAVVGDVASDARSGPWAGGMMGSALGIVFGVGAGLFLARSRRRRRDPPGTEAQRPGSTAAAVLLASAAMLLACGGDAPPLPDVPEAPPAQGDDVESAGSS